MRCAVKNCNNSNRSKANAINFFTFPSDAALLKQWISFCGREKSMNPKTSHICMEHFNAEDFENNLQFEMGFTKRRFLKHGAVPIVKQETSGNVRLYKERAQGIEKRQNKKIVQELIKEYDANSVLTEEQEENQPTVQLEEVVELEEDILENLLTTSNEKEDKGEIERLKYELKCLRTENLDLKSVQKKQAAEFKAFVEKAEKDAEISEYNLDAIKTRLTKANYELSNLEEKLLTIFTKSQIAKLKTSV